MWLSTHLFPSSFSVTTTSITCQKASFFTFFPSFVIWPRQMPAMSPRCLDENSKASVALLWKSPEIVTISIVCAGFDSEHWTDKCSGLLESYSFVCLMGLSLLRAENGLQATRWKGVEIQKVKERRLCNAYMDLTRVEGPGFPLKIYLRNFFFLFSRTNSLDRAFLPSSTIQTFSEVEASSVLAVVVAISYSAAMQKCTGIITR